MGGSSTPKPPVGSFDTCAKCEKQFTVTKYTMAANPGPGFLCHQCAKTSGIDPFKKPALPRKRKPAADKRTVVHYQERRFPSLAAICIQIISRHIDEVEMLGDIGSVNLDEIAKSLARNRSLTPENAHLFYDVQNTNLTLYDATKLTPPALSTLAMLNPNLTHLRLDYCGLMDDATLHTFSTSLPHLTHIQLLGPFLVRVPAWLSFFRSHPALETFSIEQSPRFDEECVKTLVEECGKSLREVRLKEVGKMSDGFLTELAKCEELRLLDLSYPGNGKSLSDEGCIELMSVLGETLESLDLSGHPELTDEFLRDGLGQYAKRITSLSLSDLPQLTDEGVSALFDTFAGLTTAQPQPKKIKKKHAPETSLTNHRLTHVSLSHNPSLSSLSLTSLLTHSGPSLSTLSLNGWKSVSPEALQDIPKACRENLVKVDLGWCREVDDFLVRDLVEMCGKLEEVKVWGCNKLSGACLRGLKVSWF
ncbi:hypothetical protein JAAARDRAFT_127128 [Jaapia argillacea MUCL 33604]|uniref:RNI-like protein n=1 Tax=Jaapia argillacea MUCL 33604 TaxID=933084 RepID=A0A067PYS4_9AGAM|nr:hypothetical protein JAAARDRAFT_127128 [Jaapia argillacea MUCL 33604]